ncbi:MAG: 4a-hydroxytetrahydrobiopterin dehydratase [Cyanobacteriota bacterium]|nr:4a-hydroxytetrahydrobiopterin dehydratase [Cyanobacteriota bacterium]
MPLLDDGEIQKKASQVPQWSVKDRSLVRTFVFENFIGSIDFVNRLVEPAEAAGHHPDLTISYNKVTVSLTSHDAGGLTEQDFQLAQVISGL